MYLFERAPALLLLASVYFSPPNAFIFILYEARKISFYFSPFQRGEAKRQLNEHEFKHCESMENTQAKHSGYTMNNRNKFQFGAATRVMKIRWKKKIVIVGGMKTIFTTIMQNAK